MNPEEKKNQEQSKNNAQNQIKNTKEDTTNQNEKVENILEYILLGAIIIYKIEIYHTKRKGYYHSCLVYQRTGIILWMV